MDRQNASAVSTQKQTQCYIPIYHQRIQFCIDVDLRFDECFEFRYLENEWITLVKSPEARSRIRTRR